jgi:hypothetical protein
MTWRGSRPVRFIKTGDGAEATGPDECITVGEELVVSVIDIVNA